MAKIVFMIDGWFMRKRIYKLRAFLYDGPHIRDYCLRFLSGDDRIYRIFYYDTEPLREKGHHPLTNAFIDFGKSPVAEEQDRLFQSIKRTPNFALRLGKTVWRNNAWLVDPSKLKDLIQKRMTIDDLREHDIRPHIEQKAVDMKIGLDIALIALKRIADVLIIITGDADIVPALKLARREGMQVGLDCLNCKIQPELEEHVDFKTTKLREYQSNPPIVVG